MPWLTEPQPEFEPERHPHFSAGIFQIGLYAATALSSIENDRCMRAIFDESVDWRATSVEAFIEIGKYHVDRWRDCSVQFDLHENLFDGWINHEEAREAY